MLRFALGVFFCLCVGSLVVALGRGPVAPQAPPSVTRIIVSAFMFQGAVLFFTWRLLREHQTTWAKGFRLDQNLPQAIGFGVVAVFAFLPLGWGLQMVSRKAMTVLGVEHGEQLALVALRNSGSPAELIAMGFVTILLAPVAEEILFRGLLYPTIKQYGFPRLALWGSSALFAAIHFNVAAFIPLLLLAAVLVWLYEKTNNLLAPITAHVTFNTLNFVMFLVLREIPEKLPAQP